MPETAGRRLMSLIDEEAAARFAADGFAVVADGLIDPALIEPLRARFDALFAGEFETGTPPDEVNWQSGTGDPSLTRQICNGWKADATMAAAVLAPEVGEALARLGGWSGARLIQDNVLWKPPGGRPLGFHRDNAYSRWFTPVDMLTCWIALDDVTAGSGAMELVRGSHRWPPSYGPEVEFHGPADYRRPVAGCEDRIAAVEVAAGGGSFHHGWTWHGSGPNQTRTHRRALVIHAAPVEARFNPAHLDEGMGPIYGRYRTPGDDSLPDEHFPIIWLKDSGPQP